MFLFAELIVSFLLVYLTDLHECLYTAVDSPG
jgi:hypothetical protein